MPDGVLINVERYVLDFLEFVSSSRPFDSTQQRGAMSLCVASYIYAHHVESHRAHRPPPVITQRSVYYAFPALFHDRPYASAVRIIHTATEAILGSSGGVVAASKGLVAGHISWGEPRTCAAECPSGLVIPPNTPTSVVLGTCVTAIIVVEKEASARSLIGVPQYVVICGKGYPCNATGGFVRVVAQEAERRGIPIAALVDCDPHGVQILLTYALGALKRRGGGVSSIRWLGLRPSAAAQCSAFARREAWSPADTARCEALSQRLLTFPAPNAVLRAKLDAWNAEVLFMMQHRVKCELQAVHGGFVEFITSQLPSSL